MKKYKNLEHTADLKIRAFGKTQEEVFANMALGMFENICEQKAILKDKPIKREIKVQANDLAGLLVEFLNELVTLSDINNEVYSKYKLKFEVRRTKYEVSGTIWGYKVKGLKMEIKAVTYNELKIEKQNDNWVAEVVFDI